LSGKPDKRATDKDSRSSERGEKRGDILVRVGIVLSDFLVFQEHAPRFLQDFVGEMKKKSFLPAAAEKLVTQTVGGQECAHLDCGIKNNIRRHDVF
jgi:hypothetical protein